MKFSILMAGLLFWPFYYQEQPNKLILSNDFEFNCSCELENRCTDSSFKYLGKHLDFVTDTCVYIDEFAKLKNGHGLLKVRHNPGNTRSTINGIPNGNSLYSAVQFTLPNGLIKDSTYLVKIDMAKPNNLRIREPNLFLSEKPHKNYKDFIDHISKRVGNRPDGYSHFSGNENFAWSEWKTHRFYFKSSGKEKYLILLPHMNPELTTTTFFTYFDYLSIELYSK